MSNMISRFLSAFSSPQVVLLVMSIMLFNYFFGSKPAVESVVATLNREIDFADAHHTSDPEVITVENDLGEYSFSTVGAVLVNATFKQIPGKLHVPVRTIHEKNKFEREQGAFLLALDEKTPLNYTYNGTTSQGDLLEISFSTTAMDGMWRIVKTFVLSKHNYAIDLRLSFVPLKHNATPITPRLFVTGPFVVDLPRETMTGVVLAESEKSVESLRAKDEDTRVWSSPAMAGIEDKFFLHILNSYDAGFVKRVFYRRVQGNAGLSLIVEGAPITDKTTVNTGWFLGPKDLRAVEQVNTKLSKFISLGWFSAIGRLLLSLLEYLYDFLGNYGWAIIALTLVVRIPLIPLFMYGKKRASVTEAFAKRHKNALDALKNKHKDDPVTQMREISQYYKDHGVSEMGGLYAVLPSLFSIPIFLGLYGLLNNAVVLYRAPFFGWISDLGATDPYYVLPLLMIAMIVVQQGSIPITDRSMYVMRIVMPLLLFGLFASMPAGILLYIATNTFVMVLEDIAKNALWIK